MESERATTVDSIKDVVRISVKVPEFDKHLKKAGGHIGRNIVEITIKMKTIVRKHALRHYNLVAVSFSHKKSAYMRKLSNKYYEFCLKCWHWKALFAVALFSKKSKMTDPFIKKKK